MYYSLACTILAACTVAARTTLTSMYSLVLPTEDSSILLLMKKITVVVEGHATINLPQDYIYACCAGGEPRLLFTVVMALDEFEAPHEMDMNIINVDVTIESAITEGTKSLHCLQISTY